MSHSIRLLALFGVLFAAVACQVPGPSPQPAPASDSRSLADVVVDDYIAQVQGTSVSRSATVGLTTLVDVASLKSKVRAFVAGHQVASSTHIDEILPVVMAGVAASASSVVPVGDKATEAALVGVALKTTSASLKKHVATLNTTATVSAVVASVMSTGTSELAKVAAADPVSAGAVLQAAIADLNTNVAGLGGVTSTTLLQTVVKVAVVTLTNEGNSALIVEAFKGVAQVTTDADTVTAVIKSVIVAAKAEVTTLDCTLTLKEAAVSLPTVKVDDVCTDLATHSITISDADKQAAKDAAAETDPTANLSATTGGNAIVADLPYSSTYTIAYAFSGTPSGNGTVDVVLTLPDGTTVTNPGTTNFPITGSGTFVATLKVTNHGGFRSKTVVLIIRVLPKPAEATPVANLKVSEGGIAVNGNLTYVAVGHKLVLDGTASSTTETNGLTYSLTSNSDVTIHEDAVGKYSVTQTSAGSVTYTLRVTNKYGSKSSEASQTVTIVTADSTDVQQGLTYLKAGQYDEARTSFTAAITKNPDDNDAKIWSSLLDLAALTVDPKVVSLMTKAGVQNYPTTMDSLVSKQWLAGTLYDTRTKIVVATTTAQRQLVRGNLVPFDGGDTSSYYDLVTAQKNGAWFSGSSGTSQKFVPDAAGTLYSDTWSLNGTSTTGSAYLQANPSVVGYYLNYTMNDSLSTPHLFPVIQPALTFVANDASQAPNGYNIADWSRMLMVNLAVNCLGQANTEIDNLLAGPWGANFDNALARLAAVGDTYRTVVPGELVSSTPSALPQISIGKPELLALAAHLQASKAFVQYLASINFNLSVPSTLLAAMAKNEDGIDANNDGVEDHNAQFYASVPGFRTGTLLTERNANQRAASMATFLAALNSLKAAADLYRTALADSTSVYSQTYFPLIGAMAQGVDAAVAVNTLTTASNGLGRLSTAIQTSGSLKVPSAWLSNPMMIVGVSYDWSKIDDGTAPSVTVNPGQLWAENCLDPRKWWVQDSNGFVLYRKVMWEDQTYKSFYVDPKAVSLPETDSRDSLGIPADATVKYVYTQYGYQINTAMLAKFSGAIPTPTVFGMGIYTRSAVPGSNDSDLYLTTNEKNQVAALHNWLNK